MSTELNISQPSPANAVLAGLRQAITPIEYGLIADGNAHALSVRYGSLAAAQADYPFATSLTQQIDYCATKAASDAAFGADASEHANNSHLNQRLFLPKGIYTFGNDTWLIRNLNGGVIEGAGRRATILRGNKTQLAFDGIWYTHIADFSIEVQATDAVAAMELDGNVSGHPYATRGVQGVTLQNMLIDGGMSTYALAMTRQGGSGGQGSECAFVNAHLSGASFACYYQNGFNALANQFFGGNIQGYTRNGIYVVGGTVAVYGTGFQSTFGYTQIANGGYDINVGDAGAYESIPIYGCRTESLRFLRNAGAVTTDVRAVAQQPALPSWSPLTGYGPAAPSGKAVRAINRLFVTSAGGTSGSVEPTWPLDGSPIADGTITWQEEVFDFINVVAGVGSVDRNSILVKMGRLNCQITDDRVVDTVTDGFVMTTQDVLLVDATSGAKTVYLPRVMQAGRRCAVKKADTSANTVTVMQQDIGFEGGGGSVVIAGGSRGWREFQDLGGGATTRRWFITGSG